MEAEKQSFDPDKLTTEDIKKLEDIENLSLLKLSNIIDSALTRVDCNDVLTRSIEDFDAAINGEEESIKYINSFYPLLDFKKGKEMLKKALTNK
jgi:hypothetical protein